MDLSSNELNTHIPYYLSQDQRNGLSKAFKDFTNEEEVDFYTDKYPEEKLQGDGWNQLEIIRFEDSDRQKIKGILLSNTCDIAPENERSFPPKITFAPLIKLSSYTKLLKASSLSEEQISSKIEMIKKQKVTSIFFLPSSNLVEDEYIAVLDDVHTIPYSAVTGSEKIFTLSMFGFYLFVFKLSIHFCRFHEEVSR